MGVYAIEPGCLSASAAIDKANFARKQVHSNTRVSAVQFDKKLEVKQTLTGELLSGLPQALENGEIDAFFVILGAPSTVVSELAESTDISIMQLDERTAAAMTGIYPGYYSMTIPAGTYRGQDEEVNTVGVKAVLTAEARVSSESVRAVTAALFENASSIKYTMTVPAPDIEFAVTDIPCGFHQGAADYYSWNGVTVSTGSVPEVSRPLFVTRGD